MTEEASFIFLDPRYEEYTWILQDEHNPASHPPLIATGSPLSRPGVNNPNEIPVTLTINGFNYGRNVNNPAGTGSPFGQMTPPESVEDLVKWRSEWLPQVDELVKLLENFNPEEVEQGTWKDTLQSHDDEYRRVFGGVHRTAVGPSRLAVERFMAKYVEMFGEKRRNDAMALLQGFSNRSLDRASSLWDLSRIIRNDEAKDVDNTDINLTDTVSSKKFVEAFNEMLDAFGATTNNGLQDLPTWREGSEIPMSMIRAYTVQEDWKSPREASESQRKRRVALEEEIRSIDADNGDSDSLLRLMEMAQQLMPNLEDHNLLCDQQCVFSSRKRWLLIGSYMGERDLLKYREDVFFHTRNELLEVLEGGEPISLDELKKRRALQEKYRAMPPPLFLGKSPEISEENPVVPLESNAGIIIKGTAASRGSYRGLARVFQSIDEASHLEEGQVLVVRALTPPWTPYVGVAGAIVTNSGGVLSHGAVVAREFGTPAVIGTNNGTDFIKDGDMVTVDGTTGVVVVEQR